MKVFETLPLECSIDEARALLDGDETTLLVDIRSEGERRLGHIKGARFIAPAEITSRSETFSTEKDCPLLVYCSSGPRSLRAVEKLRRMGFARAQSIAGGYHAWLKEGSGVVTDSAFTLPQLDRYSRNMLLKEVGEEGQLRLMHARVLLVGAGGLASSAALYLAACGVETLGIADFDTVDLSNLNRQVIHGTENVGRPKVESAREAIARINPHVKVMPFETRLTPRNAMEIIGKFDVVLDACDNLETKFLLNDACYFSGKPYIFGAAVGFEGQAAVFWPKEKGPCLRCLFPEPPPRHLAPT